jgi:hypothetical protein
VYDILCANLGKQRAARASTVSSSKQQPKHVTQDTATAAASDADSDIDEDVSSTNHVALKLLNEDICCSECLTT